jgi:predicted TIM-barrel fold metal-dependent hydrolase
MRQWMAWLAMGFVLAAPASGRSSENADRIVPLVDHHQHLLSPQGAEMINAAPEPAKPVPADIAGLLERRAAGWDRAEALMPLFVQDALAFDQFENEYVRGREAVSGFLSTLFARAYRFTPTAFTTDRNDARIYGYYSRDTEEGVRHFGHFTIDLVRLPEGWRIAAEQGLFPGPEADDPITAEGMIASLDEAGIDKAVVLSIAYWFDAPDQPDTPQNFARVKAENDWTLAEARQFPDRLVPFCSVNPLRSHAVAELERCRAMGIRGLKLHFANSEVDLTNPDHAQRVETLFAAASRLRLPIVVHTRDGDEFGREETSILLERILPAAPGIAVQIAHLWGGGAYSGEALAAFAEAFAEDRPVTRNLYFDLTDAAFGAAQSEERAAEIAAHMRTIGLDRMFYGSDAAIEGHGDAAASWEFFRETMPLTDEEMRTIAANVAPYLGD